MDFLNWLIETDKDLFTFINVKASAPAMDGFMELLREGTTWIPLYAFMLYWIIRFGRKEILPFIVLTIITVALTDFLSASILKPYFARPRPCYNEELMPVMRALVGCAGKYGFPSSHAANHFGLATFWFSAILTIRNSRWWWLWLWALLICYAQVYVGKHYPLDILAGTFIGLMIGGINGFFFKKWLEKSAEKSRQPVANKVETDNLI